MFNDRMIDASSVQLSPTEIHYRERLGKFGKLLTILRKERKWTQKDLANKAGLTINIVGDIERNQKSVADYLTVVRLADALELRGIFREEFFAYALLIVDDGAEITRATVSNQVVADFYRNNSSFPAFVYTPLLDIHSANSYMFAMFTIQLESIRGQVFSPPGPNILRTLFDPIFNAKAGWVGADCWLGYTELNVYTFRLRSQKYVGTKRYLELLKWLRRLPEFRNIWQTVENPSFSLRSSIPIAFHSTEPDRGKLLFTMADATFTHLPTSESHMTLYIPSDETTWKRLEEIRRTVPFFIIHFDWKKHEVTILP